MRGVGIVPRARGSMVTPTDGKKQETRRTWFTLNPAVAVVVVQCLV